MYRILIAAEKKKEYQRICRLLRELSGPMEFLPCVSDTASFVRLLSGEVPDLVITDIGLPGFEEFDPVEYIRYKKCPAEIVIVTERTDFETVQRALRFGVADYLKKPYADWELMECVQKLLHNREEQRASQAVREKSGSLYRKYLRLAEKEFMMSLLLGVPDEKIMREIIETEDNRYYILAAEGCSETCAAPVRLEQMETQVFSEDICLGYYFEETLYLFVAREEALCAEQEEQEWLRKKAEALFAFIGSGPAFLRIGVSGGMRSPEELAQGLNQARDAAAGLNFPGIGLYEEKPVLISALESHYADRALEYMEQHYGEKLSLPDVAEAVGVSVYYMSRLIHRAKNRTFSDLLTEIRVKHALELLESGEKTVQEISCQCGYPNVNYFYKVMKKQTGTTVKGIRQRRKYSASAEGPAFQGRKTGMDNR